MPAATEVDTISVSNNSVSALSVSRWDRSQNKVVRIVRDDKSVVSNASNSVAIWDHQQNKVVDFSIPKWDASRKVVNGKQEVVARSDEDGNIKKSSKRLNMSGDCTLKTVSSDINDNMSVTSKYTVTSKTDSIHKWDRSSNKVVAVERNVQVWDRRSNTVRRRNSHLEVDADAQETQTKAPKKSSSIEANDNMSVTSKYTVTSKTDSIHKWGRSSNKVVAVENDVQVWDRRSNTVRRRNSHLEVDADAQKTPTKQESTNSLEVELDPEEVDELPQTSETLLTNEKTFSEKSSVSPRSVAFSIAEEEEEEEADDIYIPTTLSRPKSAQSQTSEMKARKKAMKEMQLKALLHQISSKREMEKMNQNNDVQNTPILPAELKRAESLDDEKIAKLNDIINTKNKLLDEQNRLIQQLTEQMEEMSRADDNGLPVVVARPHSADNDTLVSGISSVFSNFFQ
ncbi:predicted protein [Chaetoceros tenuissimus]|uniref:Uncharacterized protein n=1 Tax=Chaetoceros tenuissimus TaxID=426638 RepID=A0AAD3CNV7_9STRA|nr:predicted protein [Chaetoceros tenuissimus]